MAIDPKNVAESGAQTPGLDQEAITPADDVDLTDVTRAIYIGGTGNLTVKPMGSRGDAIVTYVGLPVGTVLPIRVKEIRATGTTATNIVAIW